MNSFSGPWSSVSRFLAPYESEWLRHWRLMIHTYCISKIWWLCPQTDTPPHSLASLHKALSIECYAVTYAGLLAIYWRRHSPGGQIRFRLRQLIRYSKSGCQKAKIIGCGLRHLLHSRIPRRMSAPRYGSELKSGYTRSPRTVCLRPANILLMCIITCKQVAMWICMAQLPFSRQSFHFGKTFRASS